MASFEIPFTPEDLADLQRVADKSDMETTTEWLLWNARLGMAQGLGEIEGQTIDEPFGVGEEGK